MKMKIGSVVVILICICLTGCSGGQSEDGVLLTLNIDQEIPEGGVITVYKLTEEGMNPIDTLSVLEDGGFSGNVKTTGTTFMRLDIARKGMVNLIVSDDDGEINISIEGTDISIDGSAPSETVNDIDLIRAKFQQDTQRLNQEAIQASQQGDDAQFQAILDQYTNLEKEHLADIKSKVREAGPSLSALYGLNFLSMDEDSDLFKEIIESVGDELPDHFWLVELKESFEKSQSIAIGKVAPDFTLETPEGTELTLSDLRGQFVLIDFWAAWCKPCRIENPNVVLAYNKYGGENFEILGVSVDRTKAAWIKAIEEDGLPWKQVSDIVNSEAAELYQVNTIPATFLIDPAGKIIAKNLRGEGLMEKLEELFGE